MIFRDDKFKFSFEIPEDWSQEPIGFFAQRFQGLRVSIVPVERGANINVVCKSIAAALADVDSRDKALLNYLSSMGCEIIHSGSMNDKLAGERNTTILEYRNPKNLHENIMRKISSVHNSIEYALTFLGNPKKHDKAYERVKETFKFG